jgi:hypothetical protein
LEINAPIHLVRFNRCASFNILRVVGLAADPFSRIGTPDHARAHQQFLEDIEDQLHLVFAHLHPGLLRSFTCVSDLPAPWNPIRCANWPPGGAWAHAFQLVCWIERDI